MSKPYYIVVAILLAPISCGRIATYNDVSNLDLSTGLFSCITDRTLADSIATFILSADEYDDSGCLIYTNVVFSMDRGRLSVSISMSPELGLIGDKWKLVGAQMFRGRDVLVLCDNIPSCVDTTKLDLIKAKTIVGKGQFESLYYSDEARRLDIAFVQEDNKWIRTHFGELRMHKNNILNNGSTSKYNTGGIFSSFITDNALADSLYQYALTSGCSSEKEYGVMLFEENEGCYSVSILMSDTFCVPVRSLKRICVLGLCNDGEHSFLILCDSNIPPFVKMEALNVNDAYMFFYDLADYTMNIREVNEHIYTMDGVKWRSSENKCEYKYISKPGCHRTYTNCSKCMTKIQTH